MALLSEGSAPIALDGTRKSRGNLTKARIRWVILALVLVFGTVAGRLIQLGRRGMRGRRRRGATHRARSLARGGRRWGDAQ